MEIGDMRLDSILLAKEFLRHAELTEDKKLQSILIQFAYEEKLHADFLDSLLTKYS